MFQKLDDLSNSYKHSYANSDLSLIGRDEDCFVALYSKYNDFDTNPTPYVISMNYVIDEFNKFYSFSFENKPIFNLFSFCIKKLQSFIEILTHKNGQAKYPNGNAPNRTFI